MTDDTQNGYRVVLALYADDTCSTPYATFNMGTQLFFDILHGCFATYEICDSCE